MLYFTARRALRASRIIYEVRSRKVTTLPRGMQRFEPSSSTTLSKLMEQSAAVGAEVTLDSSRSGTTASHAAPNNPEQNHRHALHFPPWPVDDIEFNAFSVDGGHGARKVVEQNNGVPDGRLGYSALTRSTTNEGADENKDSDATQVSNVPKTVPLTHEVLRRLAAAEESPIAQAALAEGGWVCTGCWAVQGTSGATQDTNSMKVVQAAELSKCATEVPGDSIKKLFPRTVCPSCYTLRHDVQTWQLLSTFRLEAEVESGNAAENSRWWICGDCGEINYSEEAQKAARDNSIDNDDAAISVLHPRPKGGDNVKTGTSMCRCCGSSSRKAPSSHRSSFLRVHKTIDDEVATAALGSVVVTRNRTTRWRCGHCGEVNSLQLTECRNCSRERFALTVCCPQCETPRPLLNALIYDYKSNAIPASATAHTNIMLSNTHKKPPKFALSNCYQPGSTQLACLQCGSPLHGGAIRAAVHGPPSWWCACGLVNPVLAYSCNRCRLPRTVPEPFFLKQLLRSAVKPGLSAPQWDFAGCTSWLCASCGGVNRAAYQIIGLRGVEVPSCEERPLTTTATTAASFTDSDVRKTKCKARVWVNDHEVNCAYCRAPWHHQQLQGGEWWRCACQALNQRDSATCTSCGLPALDDVPAIALSAWSRGDWWCHTCRTHNYKDRLRCRCGANRPTLC